ncbi:MAG: CPBP family intramembrane metalloprotease [Ruminococcus sp.]|nr:CPBP family intramembrane metalloprotease [Ruminococcus sp.]
MRYYGNGQQSGGQDFEPAQQPVGTGYFGGYRGYSENSDAADAEARAEEQRRAAGQQTYYGGSGLSPYEYRQQKLEGQKNEKKGLFKNASMLGILLVLYNILSYVYLRVFYYATYFKCTGSMPESFNAMAKYLREEQAELIDSTAFSMAANLSIVSASAVTLLIVARLFMKIKLGDMLRPFKGAAKTGFVWAPLALTLNLLSGIIVGMVVSMFEQSGMSVPEPDFSISDPSKAALIIQFAYVCLIGPVIEEIVYRGLIIKLISPYGKGLAVFISALIFGIMHGNISQAITAFAGGILFAMVAVRYNSIVPTIIIHIFNNTVSSIPDFGDALGKNTDTLYYGVLIAVMFFGAYMLIVKLKDLDRGIKESTPKYALVTGERARYAILNPFMIIYFIFIAYEFISSFMKANS